MKFMFLDTFGIGHAIWKLLYDIFVRGPLFIVNGLGDAITYLSGQKIIDLVFGTTGHFFNIPPQFIIFLALASCLVVLFAGGVILHAMVHQKIGSAVSALVNRIIIIVLLWVLVPLFFWIINFTVVSIIHILLPKMIDGKSLANMVGSLGFTDNNNHQEWNYDVDYPDWNHYNLFLGAFGTWFTMAIFFLLGLTLVKRIFDLFLFYVVSPIIFATASSNVKWQKVNLWKEFVIGRFISTIGIVLSLTFFLNLEPVFFNAASEISSSWMAKSAFQLLFISGGAIATYQAQQIFSYFVGQTVGLADGISMLTTLKAGSIGLKSATLGTLGVAGGILFGRKNKKGFNNVASSNTKSMGGVVGIGTSVAKTTVSSVLTTAGFISGVHHVRKNQGWKKASKSVGKSIISVPAKPMNNLADQIINKTNEQLAKGKNVHVKEQNKEKENRNGTSSTTKK